MPGVNQSRGCTHLVYLDPNVDTPAETQGLLARPT
ncbi:hypothetical protein B6N60_04460 [Richelia sinica FACHB-800]|uniref:Uncharacterized protein n=1 Tax=Richelia sinica FACHB-800 TaxID=1357546 RepID=A0A975Y6X6_9NOST|nr:hypothetical protein B6N60_04460 [Richelia sinica FACHB-800]